MTSFRDRFERAGLTWPDIAPADFPFAPAIRVDNVVYISGQIPEAGGDIAYTGKVGETISLEEAKQAAAMCAANILFWLSRELDGDLSRVVQVAIYEAVDGFGAEEVASFGAPTLITRCTNDVQQIQMLFLLMLSFMVNLPLMVVGGIIMAVREDAGLSWLVWASAPVLLVIVAGIVAPLMPPFQRMQDNNDDVNGVLGGQDQGHRGGRAVGGEGPEERRV
ncbi:hypothetical protein BLX87_00910, partial [Bacillus sp. VT-16-64]